MQKRKAGKRPETLYANGLGWSAGFPGNPNSGKAAPQEPVDVETAKDAQRTHTDPASIQPNPNWPVVLSSRRGVQSFTEEQVLMGVGVDASDYPDVTIIEADIAFAPAPAGVNKASFNEASGPARTNKLAKGFGFGR